MPVHTRPGLHLARVHPERQPHRDTRSELALDRAQCSPAGSADQSRRAASLTDAQPPTADSRSQHDEIEFAGDGDGLYVVRTVVDIKNHVLETNETDNAVHAYIQVTSESVRIIERGQGASPWGPRKKVFTDR